MEETLLLAPKQQPIANKQSKFQSNKVLKCIQNTLIKKTENSLKLSLCDHDAFWWKLKRCESELMLQTYSLIYVDKNLKRNGEVTLQELNQISFPVLAYTNSELADHALTILSSTTYSSTFSGEMLGRLVREISKNYNIVAYHNFSHAFSLTLMLFQSSQREPRIKALFSDEELFLAYLAGLAHDINHPGTNNAFHSKINSSIAQQSSNSSILEKYHLREFWRIIANEDDINFLNRVKDQAKVKKFITQLILATDMAQHFSSLQVLKTKRLQKHQLDEHSEQKKFYLEQLFHACDIGNPCIDFENYMNWAALLSFEFHKQTLLEEEHQIEVTEMLRYKNLKTFYQGQVSFINFFVFPLWKQITEVWPGLHPFTSNITANLQALQDKIEKQSQKQAQNTIC